MFLGRHTCLPYLFDDDANRRIPLLADGAPPPGDACWQASTGHLGSVGTDQGLPRGTNKAKAAPGTELWRLGHSLMNRSR